MPRKDRDLSLDLFSDDARQMRGDAGHPSRDREVRSPQPSNEETVAIAEGRIVAVLTGTSFASAEAKVILKEALDGTKVRLVRDPRNKYDPDAIGVWLHGERIGYLQAQAKAKRPFVGNVEIARYLERWPDAVLIRNNAGEARVRL